MATSTKKRSLEVGDTKQKAVEQKAVDATEEAGDEKQATAVMYDTYLMQFADGGNVERFRVKSTAPSAIALRSFYASCVRDQGQRGRRLLVTYMWDHMADLPLHAAEVSPQDEVLADQIGAEVEAIFKKKGVWENMQTKSEGPIDWPSQHVFLEQVVLDAVYDDDSE